MRRRHVNNGTQPPCLQLQAWEKWNADLALNLTSHYMLSRLVLPEMVECGLGVVTNISSVNGIQALGNPAYSAAKAGIINITKYMAKFCKGKKIRVNCISPGGIFDNQPKNFIKKYKNSCLSKGLLDSKDLEGVVEFLVSKKSNFMTGQNFIIDDGWSL